MRRPLHPVLTILSAFGAIVLIAAPAGAHAVFTNGVSGFPADSTQALTLDVPHERDDATYNVHIDVVVPSGWTAQSCQAQATWTCARSTVAGQPAFTWTKTAGARRGQDEGFRFSARTASAPGSYAFKTLQTYSTGEVVRWIGASGSDAPAPELTVLAGGVSATPSAVAPNPDTTPPRTATPTRAAAAPTRAASSAPSVGATTSASAGPSVSASVTPTASASPTSSPTASASASSSTSASTSAGASASTTPSGTATADPLDTAPTASSGSDGDDGGGGNGPLLAGLGVAALLALAGGGVLAHRQRAAGATPPPPEA